MVTKENFGIMDGTYFVSKSELLQWIFEKTNLEITKIENFSSAIHCSLILSKIDPKFPLNKIKLEACTYYEFEANWLVVQAYFRSKKINKSIPIAKLIKSRPLDNLEFAQWFYSFIRTLKNEKRVIVSPVKTVIGTESPKTTNSKKMPKERNVKLFRKFDETKKKSSPVNYDELIYKIEQERDYYFNKLTGVEKICLEGIERVKKEAEENTDPVLLAHFNEILGFLYENSESDSV